MAGAGALFVVCVWASMAATKHTRALRACCMLQLTGPTPLPPSTPV